MTQALRLRLHSIVRDLEDAIDQMPGEDETPFAGSVPPHVPGKKLAVVVGHTRARPGAVGVDPIDGPEYPFNCGLAQLMRKAAEGENLSLEIFYRDRIGIEGAYKAAGAWGADAAMELHFNAAGPSATGTETIYVTPASRFFAQHVQRAMVGCLDLPDRGVKTPWQGRGSASLTALAVPSILIEPGFGSNPSDAARLVSRKTALASALVRASSAFLNGE